MAALSAPDAYPADPSAKSGLLHVQTHISHVFLSGERVYKLRKAVTLAFLDFGTRSARNADALAEIRLNRRLAPDVYLGIAPLRKGGTRIELGALSEALAPDALEH